VAAAGRWPLSTLRLPLTFEKFPIEGTSIVDAVIFDATGRAIAREVPPELAASMVPALNASPELLRACRDAKEAIQEHGRLVGPMGKALDALNAAIVATGGVA
jgi:hypothetical protein